MPKHLPLLPLCVLLASLLLGCGGLDSGGSGAVSSVNPGVYLPSSTPFGKTYGEWSAAWWQWVLAIPRADNPILDLTGAKAAIGQAGPVWFLAGGPADGTERTCTVPADKAILFPIWNGFGEIPIDGTTKTALGAALKTYTDYITALAVTVDTRSLQGLAYYRFRSPLFEYTMPDPPDAYWDIYAGTHQGMSEGYWIMLEPLVPGEHTIRFYCKFVMPPSSPYGEPYVDEKWTTYHLTVE